jgi:hypothetical protein
MRALDLFPGESIAFHLASFSQGTEDQINPLEVEQALDTCLQNEVRYVAPKTAFASAKAIRPSLPLASTVRTTPVEPTDFLQALKSEPTLSELRYLILLNGYSSVGNSKWGGGADLGVVVERYKDVTLYLDATIIDIKNREVVGSLSATANGRRGGGFGMLLFVIPIGGTYDTRFDSELCSKLGNSLGLFIRTN